MDLKSLYEKLVVDSHYSALVTPDGRILPTSEVVREFSAVHLFPGRFLPIHTGQKRLFSRILSVSDMGIRSLKTYEVSLETVDNAVPLTEKELIETVSQLSNQHPILVTNVSTFLEKIAVLSSLERKIFYIGSNTAQQLVFDHGEVGVEGLRAEFYVFPRDGRGKDSPVLRNLGPRNFHVPHWLHRS